MPEIEYPLGGSSKKGILFEVLRIVTLQMVDHLQANNLIDTFQLAYREYHSTETTLRAQNDILMHLDKPNTVWLVLCDLSATFNTTDQPILLKRVENNMWYKRKYT